LWIYKLCAITGGKLEHQNKESKQPLFAQIEANVKELLWNYGEAGYQIGLEIGKRNFSAIWVKMRNSKSQGVDWMEGIMKEAV